MIERKILLLMFMIADEPHAKHPKNIIRKKLCNILMPGAFHRYFPINNVKDHKIRQLKL